MCIYILIMRSLFLILCKNHSLYKIIYLGIHRTKMLLYFIDMATPLRTTMSRHAHRPDSASAQKRRNTNITSHALQRSAT